MVVVLKCLQELLWRNSAGSYGPTGNWDSSCCPLGSLAGCTGCDNYHCQFGPAPESGMGAVYANGFRTPSGVLLSILRSVQGRQLVKMSVTAVAMLEAKGVYALAWYQGEHVAELVLSNPSPNVIYGLPSVVCSSMRIKVLYAANPQKGGPMRMSSLDLGPLKLEHPSVFHFLNLGMQIGATTFLVTQTCIYGGISIGLFGTLQE